MKRIPTFDKPDNEIHPVKIQISILFNIFSVLSLSSHPISNQNRYAATYNKRMIIESSFLCRDIYSRLATILMLFVCSVRFRLVHVGFCWSSWLLKVELVVEG